MITDYLFINGFESACRIGTTKEERAFPQILRISLRIEISLDKAGKTDDLKFSVDYTDIIKDVRRALTQQEFNLIEAVAEKTAKIILGHTLVQAVEISVGKKIFSGIESVGAFVRREKKAHR